MLPDLPNLKRDIQRTLGRYLQRQVDARLGVFSQSPKHMIHEGDRMRTIRADGSKDESDLQKASAELTLKSDQIPALSVEERIKKLDNMAEQIARQMTEHMFGSLGATLEKAGQVVERKGKPFDAEAIFEALEKIQLDFDRTGNIQNLSIVVPPLLLPNAKKAFEQIQSDPLLQKRYEEIIVRKRLEYRDRKAARKLVG